MFRRAVCELFNYNSFISFLFCCETHSIFFIVDVCWRNILRRSISLFCFVICRKTIYSNWNLKCVRRLLPRRQRWRQRRPVIRALFVTDIKNRARRRRHQRIRMRIHLIRRRPLRTPPLYQRQMQIKSHNQKYLLVGRGPLRPSGGINRYCWSPA